MMGELDLGAEFFKGLVELDKNGLERIASKARAQANMLDKALKALPCYREPALDEDGMAEEQIQRIKSLVDEYQQYRKATLVVGVPCTELTYVAALQRADRLIQELSEFKFWHRLRRGT